MTDNERAARIADIVRRYQRQLAEAQAERDAARAALAAAERDNALLRERLKGIEERTIAAVRETLWGAPR